MRKLRYLLIVGLIFLDQALKAFIRTSMYAGESIPVVKDIFHITYVQNTGAAFSIFAGARIMLIIIPAAAMAVGVWYMEKHLNEHWTLTLSLSLIIAGGLANLIDRIALGFVTDMFDFRVFPVFNIADIAVCVGAGFLMLYTLFFYGKIKQEDNI